MKYRDQNHHSYQTISLSNLLLVDKNIKLKQKKKKQEIELI